MKQRDLVKLFEKTAGRFIETVEIMIFTSKERTVNPFRATRKLTKNLQNHS